MSIQKILEIAPLFYQIISYIETCNSWRLVNRLNLHHSHLLIATDHLVVTLPHDLKTGQRVLANLMRCHHLKRLTLDATLLSMKLLEYYAILLMSMASTTTLAVTELEIRCPGLPVDVLMRSLSYVCPFLTTFTAVDIGSVKCREVWHFMTSHSSTLTHLAISGLCQDEETDMDMSWSYPSTPLVLNSLQLSGIHCGVVILNMEPILNAAALHLQRLELTSFHFETTAFQSLRPMPQLKVLKLWECQGWEGLMPLCASPLAHLTINHTNWSLFQHLKSTVRHLVLDGSDDFVALLDFDDDNTFDCIHHVTVIDSDFLSHESEEALNCHFVDRLDME